MSLEALLTELKSLHDLEGIREQLGWDQETYLPEKAAETRASQLATISGIIHERSASDKIGELLDKIDTSDLSPLHQLCVRETRKFYDRAQRIPTSLVRELSQTCSRAHHAWLNAKKTGVKNQYFEYLRNLINLKRAEVEYRAPGKPVYDEMLDDFEPGLKSTDVDKLFAELKEWTIPFVEAIQNSDVKPNRSILTRSYPISGQQKFGLQTIKAMGFDFKAGRVDTAEHPFCGGTGPNDVRLTTHYYENDVLSSYFSIVHEAGHGLYEQGLNPDYLGTPACEAASMAFHESQSRLWENFLTRSRSFWQHAFPNFKACFPEQTQDIEFDDLYLALNAVEPSFIRVEADEVTYNLHIVLRYELERDLVNGSLAVDDLEEAWNDKLKAYLGLTPTTASEGVLQDPHWAGACFGYFPTYTYGNLYAAQIHATMREQLDVDAILQTGDYMPIREWLKQNVHMHGRMFSPDGLITKISGQSLNFSFLKEYLKSKFCMIYKI